MLYVRGNPADYDGWAQMGCRGWSFDDVLPYFRKSEHYVQRGEADYRGKGGPLQVEDYRTILPLTHRFVEAAQQAGFPLSRDLNGRVQEGVGYSQMTRMGRFRGSTARTFLAAAKHRANLRVETDALATRLLFDGKRCTGVAFRQRGQDQQAHAAREVILCGGAVNSPHLLQISGIGPAAHLQSIGVPVLHDLPGVGGNLQDHYVMRVSHRARDAVSINQLARGPRLAMEAARFALTGRGALTFGVTSAQVFCRSREGLASPDLQLLFTPASYDAAQFGELEHAPGMTVAICPVRPDSRGSIMARSPDPFAPPVIAPNYLSDANDARVLLAGLRMTRRIFAQPALAPHSVAEILPGPGLRIRRRPDGTCAPVRHHDLPPGRHLPDGRRPQRRGGCAAARARHRRAAGDRCVRDADIDHRQHQRTHHHDCGERRGDDPGGRCHVKQESIYHGEVRERRRATKQKFIACHAKAIGKAASSLSNTPSWPSVLLGLLRGKSLLACLHAARRLQTCPATLSRNFRIPAITPSASSCSKSKSNPVTPIPRNARISSITAATSPENSRRLPSLAGGIGIAWRFTRYTTPIFAGSRPASLTSRRSRTIPASSRGSESSK